MLGDTSNNETQIGFRIEAVEFRRTDQTVDGRRAFTAGIGTGEQEVFPAQSDGALRPLGGIVVDLDQAIGGIPNKRRP